jgi:hypothetical protein
VVTSVAGETPAYGGKRRLMSGGSPPIRILAVDDHPLVREGIADLVGVHPPTTHR